MTAFGQVRGLNWPDVPDHVMWFHRPFRADDWLLFAQDSPSADSGRGLSRGMFFTRDGLLVASAIQEAGLFRR